MPKSPEAFRTISEVAEWLDVPTHVLRFWESRFTQVKPVKRAGGRRYYRPADMELLGGIKRLLHDEGLTIRGVQKLLREEGVRHVAALSPPLEGEAPNTLEGKVITLTPARDTKAAKPAQWSEEDDAAQAVDSLSEQIAAAKPPALADEVLPAASKAKADPALPAAAGQSETPDPDQADDAAVQPIPEESLPEQVDPADAPYVPEEPDDAPASNDAPNALDPRADAPAPQDAGAVAPDTAVDVPVAPALDAAEPVGDAQRTPLADIPLPDLDALPGTPLSIAPLIAKGRAARRREAETFAPIAARAKALLRDLNVRM